MAEKQQNWPHLAAEGINMFIYIQPNNLDNCDVSLCTADRLFSKVGDILGPALA